MNKRMLVLFLAVLTLQGNVFAEWITSVPEALRKAQAEDKAVLLDFTGSDWCGWCIKLRNEVFDKPEFKEFADRNLVMVELDFPRRKAISDSLRNENKRLAEQYQIEGYPTIIILDKSGRKVHQTGYLDGGPVNYIAKLKEVKAVAWKEAPQRVQGERGTDRPTTAQPGGTSAYVPPPAPADIHYQGLALKGITGNGAKKFAMINNQTFATGETARVKINDRQVKITCKEIKEASVMLQIEGEKAPLELTMGEPLQAKEK